MELSAALLDVIRAFVKDLVERCENEKDDGGLKKAIAANPDLILQLCCVAGGDFMMKAIETMCKNCKSPDSYAQAIQVARQQCDKALTTLLKA